MPPEGQAVTARNLALFACAVVVFLYACFAVYLLATLPPVALAP